MVYPNQDNAGKNANVRTSNIREFKEFKLNGVVVQGDVDAPSDAEFEWMPNDD